MARVERVARTSAVKTAKGEITILSARGRTRRKVRGSAPIPTYVRPGDAVFDAIGGKTPGWWMLVDWSFFWTGTGWGASPSVVALSSSDLQDLAKVRRKHLKKAGYL